MAASIGDGVVGDGDDGSFTAGRFVGDLVGLPVVEVAVWSINIHIRQTLQLIVIIQRCQIIGRVE